MEVDDALLPLAVPVDDQRIGLPLRAAQVLRREHRAFEVAQLRPGVGAQLVGQDPTPLAEDGERVTRPPAAVQRANEQCPEVLVQRRSGDEVAQLPHERGMPTQRQVRLHPGADGRQPRLLECLQVGQEPGLTDEVGQRRPAPQAEGLVQGGDGGLGSTLAQRRRPGIHELPEPEQVQLVGGDGHEVAGVPSEDGPWRAAPVQRAAQAGDVHLQRVADALGDLVPPHHVDQPVGRHGAAGCQQERGEHEPLLAPAEVHRLAADPHLQGPQDAALGRRSHLCRGPPSSGHPPILAPPESFSVSSAPASIVLASEPTGSTPHTTRGPRP